MPIYEYRCTACDNLFEEWAKNFDSPEHEPCPKCGGDAARVISRTSFVLEGSGWYVTEYGNRKSDHESGAGAPGVGETPHDANTKPDTPDTPDTKGAASSASSADSEKTPAAKPEVKASAPS
ncbi:MAG: zinc ribbon domain-containing protein, partial [Bilophila sp.]